MGLCCPSPFVSTKKTLFGLTGFWQSETGKWRISYTEEETCHLLAGVSIVTDEAGVSTTLRAGDSFVIPKGFTGTWEVVETSRKLYAIYEEPDQ